MKEADLKKTMEKYQQIRTKRLELDKQSETLKAEETMLRSMVLKECMGRLSGSDTIFRPKGSKVEAELKMSASGEITDWDVLKTHIIKTGEFDLIQKRLVVTAARARWEVGKEVPGVKQVQEPNIIIRLVKEP